ncbi:MAG: DMT family transporter [Pseudomonadota bacterium]
MPTPAWPSPTVRLFVGAALISLSPVWVKLVSVSPTVSGFYRVLIGGVALALYLLLSGKRLGLSRRAWWMLLFASVFLALDLWFWHRSIEYVGPGLSTLLANFQVFVMMFASLFVLREAPTPLQLVAIPLAIVGLGMIVGFDLASLSPEYRLGIVFGLLTAVSYAGSLLMLRASRKQATTRVPSREVAVMSLTTAAILGATALLEGESLAVSSVADLSWLAGYGILSHCLGWLFIASSLPEVTPTEAGIALLLQPTLSFIWDVLFFARPMTTLELAGAALALTAIFLGSRPRSDKT